MNAFIVDLKNKPGAFAKVAEAIGAQGINITGFAGAMSGDTGSVILLTADEIRTRRVLTDTQWHYREVELVSASLADKPGTLAEVTKTLAKAGLNVEAALPIGMAGNNVHVAFATDDPVKAREVLDRQPIGSASR